MNKERIDKIKDGLKKHGLNLLIIWTAQMENRLFELKKQGEEGNSQAFNKIRRKRNAYREVLLEKLQEWKEDKHKFNMKPEEEVSMSNVLDKEEKIKDFEMEMAQEEKC